jgi:hypothetical protein
MRNRAIVVAVTVLAAMLAAGYLQAGAAPAGPPEQNVREQNLDTNGWIAVHEQGTANVNVTGTPNVNVSGGTVDVGNLPQVQTVTDANHPALQPFQEGADAILAAGDTDEASCVEVPSGMRAVIQHVSGELTTTQNQGPYRVSLRTILGQSDTHTTFLEPRLIKPISFGFDQYQWGEPVSVYADSNFQDIELCLTVWRPVDETADEWDFSWSVSGYLVDV